VNRKQGNLLAVVSLVQSKKIRVFNHPVEGQPALIALPGARFVILQPMTARATAKSSVRQPLLRITSTEVTLPSASVSVDTSVSPLFRLRPADLG
jgi:hypothetical protein